MRIYTSLVLPALIMRSISAVTLYSNMLLAGAVYWNLPVIPEGPTLIQPLPNTTDCSFSLPDVVNSFMIFPEGDFYRGILAQNANIMTTTSSTTFVNLPGSTGGADL